MESAEIRSRFLRFFETRGHTVVPSAPLPLADPTLLLVNAGMVPFKPFFLGEQTPPYPRAASVQKCVRTLDIDEVGKTTRHGSFFQMAGNFSFGDYFKEGAIPLAWELLTNSTGDGGFGFAEDRLWVTVYDDDDEAAEIWHRDVGIPVERIQRRGLNDNYWHMGVPGPGGPCSEIYFDRGPEHGKDGGPIVDEERFLEVWNLVFMQYALTEVRRKDDFDIAGELPAKNIDTGMGLERMAALLQGVENIYEIDTMRTIIDRAAELTGRRYGADPDDDVRFRVVADHTRTALMLIGDQVVPGNEGRGYVLRRIMRRVIRSMRLLGSSDPIVRELTATAIEAMGPQYPELEIERSRIFTVAEAEEAAFAQTLRTGTQIFDLAAAELQTAGSQDGQRRHGLPPARHLRVPDRPHARDGVRAGARGRRGRLPTAHGRAAQPGEGRRQGEEDRSCRRRRLPVAGRRRRALGVHRLHRAGERGRAPRHPARRSRGSRRRTR